ncbi:MAG TPA: TetR/AcrR family transcriptional regulator [Ktedonobacteraceae bacterium]
MSTIRRSVKQVSTRTPQPEQPESDERKLREERILDAATTLLVRWGYRKTTIDDVAREAGVGKGTIYLHWKDKNELFRAAIWRERQRYSDELQRRIAADPEGGLLHRITVHGMLAALSNPLMSAIIRGQSDIFNGFLGASDTGFLNQLVGDSDAYFVQLQQTGLIRADIPASIITYLLTALKVGVINSPDIFSQEQLPSMEQLTEAISDLVRRWLEPEQLPSKSAVGKLLWTEYLDKVKESE